MRGKFIYLDLLLAAVMVLSSCMGNIEAPDDELRMYSWEATSENGSEATLIFHGSKAFLRLKNDDHRLILDGLCIADDSSLTICDEKSGMNVTFGYTLYGDRVELTGSGGALTLDKVE